MEGCVFCDIVNGTIPCRKIYEDDDFLAFHDLSPQAPTHFLVIPKRHVAALTDEDAAPVAGGLLGKARELAIRLGCAERGGRFVINCKSDGGQTVNHLHIHVLAGRALGWPPG
jgi:histidine triad (HIT) family protein